MEGDRLQGEEGFVAFDLRTLTSSNSGRSRAVLTMQGKFSSSSITGPGKKQRPRRPPSECDNEAQRGRGGRRPRAAGQRITHRAVVNSSVKSEQLPAGTSHSSSDSARDVTIQ